MLTDQIDTIVLQPIIKVSRLLFYLPVDISYINNMNAFLSGNSGYVISLLPRDIYQSMKLT